ncbi:MAG: ribose 5-phosphate isomerase B [Planctomycetia bacterium]|uniref:Ribose 5-phosphate isomerase B n=1 Tax=Candidatus Brocadia sapporoensis TaxID=392547 RepID=A0A1V6LYL1_9BACT|nr:ribose 5-phosphate isomerase B [Candidatus Brocadia sapporoensis]MCC7237885.1 ribose 5-phosphate isomerase B [Candidatus Brocadia sp.]QOJ05774.1 MAG: ribose 5-phosphate isomerase B [Planctomycetia bacterium]TVL97764.1 MAG: ribose 5-phosphate isomerase B [Candidatus Brocadia sp. BL1]MDG6004744.1 ribose 5-phosphate isomerase B [Candidatus Brocadia sp.]OQD45221.1 ribose 5-phosphate isomerase B [Candidatus Brocadia sapporoensis]
MKIALASDHRGFDFKKHIASMLTQLGYTVKDFGTNKNNESVDYPDYGLYAARAVGSGECERGILVCGTGIGMSLVANKVKGVRAACCHNLYTAEMSRRHNDSNVLCIGADIVDEELLEQKVKLWLETPFEGGRHARRVGKITELENGEGI